MSALEEDRSVFVSQRWISFIQLHVTRMDDSKLQREAANFTYQGNTAGPRLYRRTGICRQWIWGNSGKRKRPNSGIKKAIIVIDMQTSQDTDMESFCVFNWLISWCLSGLGAGHHNSVTRTASWKCLLTSVSINAADDLWWSVSVHRKTLDHVRVCKTTDEFKLFQLSVCLGWNLNTVLSGEVKAQI